MIGIAVKVEIPLQRNGIFARIKDNKNVDKIGSISFKIQEITSSLLRKT